MRFFPDPESRISIPIFGIEIFYYELDQKIPKSRGSGFENTEKSRVKNPDNPKSPGIGTLKPQKNPDCKIPKIPISREKATSGFAIFYDILLIYKNCVTGTHGLIHFLKIIAGE